MLRRLRIISSFALLMVDVDRFSNWRVEGRIVAAGEYMDPHSTTDVRSDRSLSASRSLHGWGLWAPRNYKRRSFDVFSNLRLFFTLFALLRLGVHDHAHHVSLAKLDERRR